jgi:hypothetical protein
MGGRYYHVVMTGSPWQMPERSSARRGHQTILAFCGDFVNRVKPEIRTEDPSDMTIDPHKHEEHYRRWKETTAIAIPSVSTESSRIIKQYLADMEAGRNIG